MLLTKHSTEGGIRWAIEGQLLPPSLNLSTLLELPREAMFHLLKTLLQGDPALGA